MSSDATRRRRGRWSLRARLYALAFVVALPAVGYAIYDILDTVESGFAKARVELATMTQITSADTAEFLTGSRFMLTRMARRMSIPEAGRGNCDFLFRDFSLIQATFSNLGLADRAGTLLCTSHPVAGGRTVSVAHRGWFRQVADGHPFAIGEVMLDLVTGERAVALGVPVHDAAGEFAGALGISLSLHRYVPATAAATLTPGAVIVIVNREGKAISHSLEPWRLAGEDAGDSAVVQAALTQGQGFARGAAFDAVERIWSFAHIEGADWVVLAGVPVDEVLDAVVPGAMRRLVYTVAIIALLGFLAWYIGRSIERPVRAISHAARLVTAGKLDARVAVRGPAEIEDVADALNEMLDVREKAEAALRESETLLESRVSARTRELEQANARLHTYAADLARLGEMGERFQACVTAEEAAVAAVHVARELSDAGGVFLGGESSDRLEAAASWGGLAAAEQAFAPEDCLALRLGKTHLADDARAQVRCPHVQGGGASLCVPLAAQGEIIGVLHLRGGRLDSVHDQTAGAELLGTVQTVAERTALAIVNLRLRETLRAQSIRDGLTDLFNRRFLEETLDMQERVARRNGGVIGLMMLDVDHFKRFNDAYGHDAGDQVLREIAGVLRRHARTEDIACRYGGEELCLVMPGASADIVHARAEQIRRAVATLRLKRGSVPLGEVTISAGVAGFPDNGETWQIALRAADAALYRAKRSGRNRVETAS